MLRIIAYGVVDRAENTWHDIDLDIVLFHEGQEQNMSRFHHGNSCTGWFPLGLFDSLEEAKEFIRLAEGSFVPCLE